MMAHKYSGNIQQGLLANANTGGENVHRGIVLGALLGAAEGYRAIPAKWITGLKNHKNIHVEVERFVSLLRRR